MLKKHPKTYVLGISEFHDANAALVDEHGVIAAAEEERFNRKKHYFGVPVKAIKFVIDRAGLRPEDIQYIALTHRERPGDLYIARNLSKLGIRKIKRIFNIDHHRAHAASAYRTSGWSEATVVTLDGMGDGISGTVYHCIDGDMRRISEFDTTGSLGWFYSAVTEAIGFRPNDEEGKTMGLAAYGKTSRCLISKLSAYAPRQSGLLLQGKAALRTSGMPVNGFYRCHFEESRDIRKLAIKYGRENVAACAQLMIEDLGKGIVRKAIAATGCGNLAVAGGIFFNVKLNMALESLPCVREIRPHPAAGDSGLSLGAALEALRIMTGKKVLVKLDTPYLGPEFTTTDCVNALKRKAPRYRCVGFDELPWIVSGFLRKGMVIGWFQGRMEYGPRALGARSVLADPRNARLKDRINNKLKRREWFMPFAPTILLEHVDRYAFHPKPIVSPYMIKAFKGRKAGRRDIIAATHVDGTIRAQTLTRSQNPLYYDVIRRFYKDTSVPAVLNTSFNRHGIPMACSPKDAVEHLEMGCIDALVMNNVIVERP